MNEKIRVAICGYGNLGKGVEKAIAKNGDMELKCIITRREPDSIKPASEVPVISVSEALSSDKWISTIDVVIMCGGSAKDLPEQVPQFVELYNTVDSFDTHAKIPEYFDKVNDIALDNDTLAIISVGWDPGLFSKARLEANSILSGSVNYTFWGIGVSQGHSDAIRRIEGVKDAVQLTVPVEEAMERVRKGENPTLSAREMHSRECYVSTEKNASIRQIEEMITSMPNYFADYDTTVKFVCDEMVQGVRGNLPHGGSVISSGTTGDGNKQAIEYSLKLESNPEFTGSVLVAYARAAYRMSKNESGAKTVFDVAPAMLSPLTQEEMLKKL